MPEQVSKSQYITSLARELLDDIELSRLPAEALLLKATRLVRLEGAPEDVRGWLESELIGYRLGPILEKWGPSMGRMTDAKTKLGYWGPLAQIEAQLATLRLRLQGLRLPDVSLSVSSANPNEWVTNPFGGGTAAAATAPVNAVIAEAKAIGVEIATYASIRIKVLAWLHRYVSNVYHQRAFSGLAESIFERYKASVDALLASRCGDVIQKIPSVYDRLAEGDQEAIGQALTTCRRIIDDFADAVYPPSPTPIEMNGQAVNVGPPHHQNRINAYIHQNVSSGSRQRKMKRTLSDLYDRVATRVHHDVTLDEARALFLETYLLLGDVLTLAPPPPVATAPPEETPPQADAGADHPQAEGEAFN